MNKDLIQLILDFPLEYNAKEIVGVLWGQGIIISKEEVEQIRNNT